MTGAIAVVTAGQVRLAGVLAQEDGEPVEEEHVEHEAENAFLPETTEIIWHTIAFVVIAALLLKFGLPAAKNMAKARTERIAAEMGAAEAAKRDAAEAAAQVKAQLADAENEHLRVVEEA